MKSPSKRNDIVAKLVALLQEEGLVTAVATGSLEDSLLATQEFVDAMTLVQAKIICSHLMKHANEGVTAEAVGELADHILDVVTDNLEDSLDWELERAIKMLKGLIQEDLLKPKKSTSH